MESSGSNTDIQPKMEDNELTQLKNSLPKEPWFNGQPNARKTGTTWLKALIYAICNRENNPNSTYVSPLLTHNPHELVPQLESNTYFKSKCPNLSGLKSPRICGTHVPFSSLPSSIKESKCKIIYIFRNPFDTFVSSWLFYKNLDVNNTMKPEFLGQYFDMYCEGKVPFGPFEDHMLGYWNQSLQTPEKVLFIKYEDLKENPKPQLKKIAEFVGFPFSEEEDGVQGSVIDGIVKLCSLENLKEIAAPNKSARVYPSTQNDKFFRKGIVGDCVNYLTPTMVERLGKLMEEKFCSSSLSIF
ncbi:Cytosolic sulfotransferase 14 [Bienertia sinuspersici]